tara:strand:+ start:88 stop:420 length:333 start_codon:yes stop_codon:yes gene_type:complete
MASSLKKNYLSPLFQSSSSSLSQESSKTSEDYRPVRAENEERKTLSPIERKETRTKKLDRVRLIGIEKVEEEKDLVLNLGRRGKINDHILSPSFLFRRLSPLLFLCLKKR